jgi:hypothetical protein
MAIYKSATTNKVTPWENQFMLKFNHVHKMYKFTLSAAGKETVRAIENTFC